MSDQQPLFDLPPAEVKPLICQGCGSSAVTVRGVVKGIQITACASCGRGNDVALPEPRRRPAWKGRRR